MSDIPRTGTQSIEWNMNRLISFVIVSSLLIMANGCQKLPSVKTDRQPDIDGPANEVSVEIVFSVASPLSAETRSLPANAGDDAIDRIDIYSFDEAGWTAGHHTIKAEDGDVLDLDGISFTDTGKAGSIRTYLVLANLSDDTADYIGFLDNIDINRYPEGIVPWSANCRPGRLVMGGTGRFEFGSDDVLDVQLYRYMSRFEIGTVTADFDDPEYFGKAIRLVAIAFANSWDFIRITQGDVTMYDNDPRDLFGGYVNFSSSEAFGGIDRGFSQPNTININLHSHYDGEYCPGDWGADGVLAQKFKYLYNNNFKLEAHELNLDCPESLKEVSQYSFSTGTAKLCPSSADSPGQVTVDRVFYSLPTYFAVKTAQPCSWNGQDRTHKMVIAVSIDGEIYFYPIRLDCLQPNTTYKIRNISLRGKPTLYSNFYEWSLSTHSENTKEAGSVPAPVKQKAFWKVQDNVAETDNLILY